MSDAFKYSTWLLELVLADDRSGNEQHRATWDPPLVDDTSLARHTHFERRMLATEFKRGSSGYVAVSFGNCLCGDYAR